ncbi:ACP S-malonyltransferase [Bythopirellula polymerisocia]|uniref:Malonyl CoA-acyl carrier protein transacylase n=1 Tax=Bythopirellula polymerisocia TaxID=2528003 RepID=A0A5C6CEV9_9BACT|nr:ACP S-malonyltransferase [Bythopirellula polymerisocia]TWU21961.1 Malonyl CoA-acyl carrier protein transacylase [Bythopirellula polymerisocia]
MTKTAFLFPGQGAQSVGMGAALASSLPKARGLFDRAADILGYDLLELCTSGPPEKLNSTVHSQPALFVCSLAALEKLKQDSPEVVEACSASAGLSLGEYTAMVFAGAMKFDAALRVVQVRGQAMQDASDAAPSGMVSVLGLDRAQVEELVDQARGADVLQLANFLCPGNIVVSGSKSACERITPLAEEAGAMKVIPLAVAGAFHTPLMQPAVERLQAALADVDIVTPRIPVVSNVDARPHEDPAEIRSLLERQVLEPVLWENSIQWLIGEFGIESCYEIGPGRVLRGLMKRISRKLPFESVEA